MSLKIERYRPPKFENSCWTDSDISPTMISTALTASQHFAKSKTKLQHFRDNWLWVPFWSRGHRFFTANLGEGKKSQSEIGELRFLAQSALWFSIIEYAIRHTRFISNFDIFLRAVFVAEKNEKFMNETFGLERCRPMTNLCQISFFRTHCVKVISDSLNWWPRLIHKELIRTKSIPVILDWRLETEWNWSRSSLFNCSKPLQSDYLKQRFPALRNVFN